MRKLASPIPDQQPSITALLQRHINSQAHGIPNQFLALLPALCLETALLCLWDGSAVLVLSAAEESEGGNKP